MHIYFDSNIFRKIKPDSKLFHPELFKTVESLRKAFVFIFSDAHLSDLSKSDATYRQMILNAWKNMLAIIFQLRSHL
jgi:galactose-1-phosphate uridylyltransferase